MSVAPPTYEEAEGASAPAIPDEITFVDFIPFSDSSGSVLSVASFKPLSDLIQRANAWLKEHPEWKVKTVETVRFPRLGLKLAETNKLSFGVHSSSPFWYIGGLRLWLIACPEPDKHVQQIGCLALSPTPLHGTGIFSLTDYENLPTMLDRINRHLASNPLPGKILRIETINIGKFGPQAEPHVAAWPDKSYMVFTIRIFYEVGEPEPVEIGFADFVPLLTRPPEMFLKPEYEGFTPLFNRAVAWCYQHTDLNIINFQTLAVPLDGWDYTLQNQATYYDDGDTGTMYYLRMIRVAYTRGISAEKKASPSTPLGHPITCRTFPPGVIASGVFTKEFEPLQSVKNRTEAWIRASGAKIFCAETIPIRAEDIDLNAAMESSVFCVHRTSGNNKYATIDLFVTAWRLYFEGPYTEPPAHAVPPMPQMKTSNCVIS